MRLTLLEITNFRSILHTTLTLGNVTTLLGPNNHGKSNLIAALEFFLSPAVKVAVEDFFADGSTRKTEITVEAVFADLTDQERTTFHKYLLHDGRLRLQRWAKLDEHEAIETGYRGWIEQPDFWWLREDAFDRLKTRELLSAAVAEVPSLAPLLDIGGRITQTRLAEFQAGYIQSHLPELTFQQALEQGPLLGAKNIAGGTLPDFFLVPAVRDLSDETKTTGTSTFGRLLQRAISEMTARDPRLAEIESQLAQVVGDLNERPQPSSERPETEIARLERVIQSELSSWGVGVKIRVIPPELKKVFELGTELWIDDGHNTNAERKGHGLQRAVIYSLIRAWSLALRAPPPTQGTTRARAASESVIFAFEEPELFLHPHAQRTLSRSLTGIGDTPEHQVVLCTHSTHFVNLLNYRSIAIVNKPSTQAGTIIRQCTNDLFEGEDNRDRKHRFHMAAWINPDRGELFFADKVVLVEGETEQTILPYLAHRLNIYNASISIIDCGSKHNLPLYIEIMNAFRLRYAVVHDEDPLPDPIPPDWHPDKTRAKRDTFALNDRIRGLLSPGLGVRELIMPDFEGVAGVSANQVEKKGKALAALDHLESLRDDQLPARLIEITRSIFS